MAKSNVIKGTVAPQSDKPLTQQEKKNMATSAQERQAMIDKFKSKAKQTVIDPKLGHGKEFVDPAKTKVKTPDKPAGANGADTQAGQTVGEQLKSVGLDVIQYENTPIEPKNFQSMPYTMGTLNCQMVIMTMKDVYDYIGYATDLYDIPYEEDGKELSEDDRTKALKKFVVDHPDMTFQRDINAKRESSIASYLADNAHVHFLPPIICVAGDDTYQVNDDGSVTISESGIAALDGQHRKAGIDHLFRQPGMGPDSDFSKEQIPVVILDHTITLEQRQQIFSDINRTPKTVSKALNILFDHRDPYAVITKQVADALHEICGVNVVDLTHTSPAASSNHVAALSYIYNLVVNFAANEAGKKDSHIRHIDGKAIDTNVIVGVALAVIQSMPDFEAMKNATMTYKAVKGSYLCYSSTAYQAIGNALRGVLFGRPLDFPIDKWQDAVSAMMQEVNWSMSYPVWSQTKLDDDTPVHPVIVNGRVQTRKENVARAGAILSDMWSKFVLPTE